MADRRLTVGVIGGMGPEATADFFAKLVAATPARRDQDHLHVLIDCDPAVPDRTAAIEGVGPSPAARLAAMARGLVDAGAELLVMPCNTAHAFEAAVRDAAGGVPFVSMIDATADAVVAATAESAAPESAAPESAAPTPRSVGLLATVGTLRSGIYHDAFARRGIAPLVPDADDQRIVNDAIAAVKGGQAREAERSALREVAQRLVRAGAGAIVTACTELPLLLGPGDVMLDGVAVPVIASTDALVARTIRSASAGDADVGVGEVRGVEPAA